MAILILEHHPLDAPYRLGEVLRDHGHRLRIIRHHRGDALPPDLDDIDGVIAMGGPMDVDQRDDHPWMTPEIELLKQAHEASLPVVGICLGAQLVAEALGGEVARMEKPEVGLGETKMSFFGTTDPILQGWPWTTWQYHAHGCEVTKAPAGGTPMPLMSTTACKNQAFRVGLTTYAFQFHFEWTRRAIHDFLDGFPEFVKQAGLSRADLDAQLDAHYAMYRHMGDRLCQNLCDRLFVIDKRLSPSGASVDNFHAHQS